MDLSVNQLSGTLPRLAQGNSASELPSTILVLSANRFTGLVPFPVQAAVFLAHSNRFDGLAPEWCNASSTATVSSSSSLAVNERGGSQFTCSLAGNRAPEPLPCWLPASSCDGQLAPVSMSELCDVPCSCPQPPLLSEEANNYEEGEAPSSAEASMLRPNMSLCTDTTHGAVCEFECGAGFAPGVVSVASSEQTCDGFYSEATARHVATCDGFGGVNGSGVWSFADSEGSVHGCVELGCGPLTSHELMFADAGLCDAEVVPVRVCRPYAGCIIPL